MENTNQTNTMSKDSLLKQVHGIEAYLLPLFAKLPHIPEGGRKILADITPWLALIFGILGLFNLLVENRIMILLEIPALLTGNVWIITGFITTALGLIVTVLELLAFNPLKAHMKKGWNYLFYGLLLGALSTIVSVVGGALSASIYSGAGAVSSLIGGAIGFVIGGWLLFEIRDQYKA